ncbi:MAG TPA: 30S ribosomal protein S6 [Patescibacteria group bacterium]|jgi:small subunit ribosomal protein S6|nr:30S ribosomal protein S6 [Patescibacteria group bacterium]
MKTYQLVLVLKTSVTEANRKKFIETIKGWFGDAKVTKEEEWGEKTLAYEIKHEKTGFYLNFLLESVKIPADLEKKLFANENVLRHLVIKV